MSTHTTNAIVQTAKLVTLGDAIRAKAGLSGEMTLDEMAAAVANIETGGNYQSKTVAPSTSQQTVTPDSGYDALSSVTVNAMPAGSAATPATSITVNPTISVSAGGLITASVSGSQSVTPSVSAGYVASGTAGTVSVSGSNTQQLSTQSAQTITPTTTAQTIASGKYLTGTQTIEGIVCTNLTAENIADGVTVKIGTATDDDSVASITGTHSGGGGGGTTAVEIDLGMMGGRVFYLDSSGTATDYEGLGTFQASSISGSLITVFHAQAVQDSGISGVSEYATINLGSRANFRECVIFQVN